MKAPLIEDVLKKYETQGVKQEAIVEEEPKAELLTKVKETDANKHPGERRLIADIFQNDYCSVPSHPIIIAASNAMQDKRIRQGGMHRYKTRGKKAEEIDVSFISNNVETLLNDLAKMDDLTIDVFILAITQWLYSARRADESVLIDVDKIMYYRGIQPKRKDGYSAGYREDDRRKVVETFELLDKMYVRAHNITVYEKNKKPREVTLESKVLAITDRIKENGEIKAFNVTPGRYGNLLHGFDRRQTAMLCKKIVEYDYYRNNWEKRIGLYLTFQWAIRRTHGTMDQSFRISTILESINMKLNERYPLRTKERLEKAFDKLAEDGVITSWSYCGNSSINIKEKGWASTWLGSKVNFGVPDVILQQYAAIAENRQQIQEKIKGKVRK